MSGVYEIPSKYEFGNEIIHSNMANFYISRMASKKPLSLSRLDYETLAKPGYYLMTGTMDGEAFKPDDFQLSVMNSKAVLNHAVKGRQMGFSLVCVSGTAVAKSHMYPNWKSIIVSYNLTEAKQKIKMARLISEGVHPKLRKKIKGDSSLYLIYENGSEIYSVFSPRGHNNADVYLDEFSYCADPQQIYKDAFPIVERQVDKKLLIGGTPFGRSGLFYDIAYPPPGKYRNYNRFVWFWWDSDFYCKDIWLARDGDPKKGIPPAYMFTTDERVYKYGTYPLIEIYENMLKEDFQQEYEACFQDERTSYFPYKLIMDRMGFYDLKTQEHYPEKLEDIQAWNQGVLFAGFDVGRTRNTSELYVFDYRNHDKDGSKNSKLIQVFNQSFDKTDFDTQEQFLRNFLKMYENHIGILQIDRNQIGMHLAERLETDFPHLVQGVQLTNQSKERMATCTKLFMTKKILELLPDKETISHIHSIKQTVTAHGNTRFDADKSEKHHADRFWAIALAVDGANSEENLGVIPEIYRGG